MYGDVKKVTEVQITMSFTAEEGVGVLGALSYFNLAAGGNNFEMGYAGDPEALRDHRAAKKAATLLEKLLTKADKE